MYIRYLLCGVNYDYRATSVSLGSHEPFGNITDTIHADLSVDGKITAASVQAAVGPNGGAQQVELVEFTDAFSIPRLAFDPVQRKLHLNNKPRHLYGSAEVSC